MTNRSVTKSKRYRIIDEAEVSVTAMIGAGQPGGWVVALDDKRIEGVGEKSLVLGKGLDLVYRELRVEFVIHDSRQEHDRLNATLVVRGGEEELTITAEEMGLQGDTATYSILVEFV